MTKKQMIEVIKKAEMESYRQLCEALRENNEKDNELTDLYRQRWGAISELCKALNIPT